MSKLGSDEDMIQAMFSGYESEELDDSMEAEKDVLGTKAVSYLVQKDDAVIEMAIQGMKEALDSTPSSQKEAYTEALREAPKLVELETPMRRFLLACDFNYWAAAKQLIQNWQERKQIFGDRFCLPMKIPQSNEQTALTPDVADNLQRGAVFLAPLDSYRRAVIVTDMDKVTENYRLSLNKIRQKLYFYMLQIASEQDLVIVNGAIHLIAYNSPSTETLVAKCKQDGSICEFFLNTNCAAKTCAHHFYATKKASFITKNLLSLKDFIASFRNLQFRIRVHMEDTNEAILYSISQYGFSKKHILRRSGGTADGIEWFKKRLQKEGIMYNSEAENIDIKKKLPKSQRVAEHKEKQKRKMAKFQAWAEDHLAKHKLLRLESEVEELERDNTTLHQEQAFLESQIACAEYFASKFENDLVLIVAHLAQCLAKIPAIDPQLLSSSKEKQQVLARSLFKKYLLFLGKSPMTGLFLLEVRSGLSLEQTHFAEGLKKCVMEESLLHLGRDTSSDEKFPRPAPNSSVNVTRLNEKKKLVQEMDEDLDVKPPAQSPGDDEEESLLTRELEHSQALIASLSRQKEQFQNDHHFLRNGLYSVTQLALGFEQFHKAHKECLAGFYASILTYYTDYMGPWGTYALAEFVLNYYTYFDGRHFRNSIAELAASNTESHVDNITSTSPLTVEERQAYQLALQVVQPIMRPFLQRGITENSHETEKVGTFTSESGSCSSSRENNKKQKLDGDEEAARRHREYRLKRKKSLKRL